MTSPRPIPLTTAGSRLEAYWIGPPPAASPTLVFLHEGLGSARAWLGFAEAVAKATGWGALVYVLLSDCGHFPHRDQREETLAAIARFVSSR